MKAIKSYRIEADQAMAAPDGDGVKRHLEIMDALAAIGTSLAVPSEVSVFYEQAAAASSGKSAEMPVEMSRP